MIQLLKRILFPTPDWKKVVHLHYSDPNKHDQIGNILTIQTLDFNTKHYKHCINEPTHEWKRYPSLTIVKDQELIKQLNHYYLKTIRARRTKTGWAWNDPSVNRGG